MRNGSILLSLLALLGAIFAPVAYVADWWNIAEAGLAIGVALVFAVVGHSSLVVERGPRV